MTIKKRNENGKEYPYMRFEGENLILRDELAIDRTILANERTLLSYLRSGVALIIAGVSIIHYAHELWFRTVGMLCIPVGIIASIIGVLRYRRMHEAISRIQRVSVMKRQNAGVSETEGSV